ncbi:hypothetical protein B7P43_G14239 [Cryptotermes secundus]|uniref:Uncharacterized protein n=1 Tax=Cryptotermes secundus TaxID=105785 RepID=A0A2J7RBJ4_9NEOP|nr:hypothetical protein B7P43_G14239 [Cryptotermes secundus]
MKINLKNLYEYDRSTVPGGSHTQVNSLYFIGWIMANEDRALLDKRYTYWQSVSDGHCTSFRDNVCRNKL